MLENKSVAVVIILTIVTCGIYGYVWLYKTSTALKTQGNSSVVDPIVELLLAIFLGLVGFILFAVSADANLSVIRSQRGLPPKDNKVLYIILAVIIPVALIGVVQNDINEITPTAV